MAFEISAIKAEALSTLEGVDHAFFTRIGGLSTGIYEGCNTGLGSDDTRENILENRRQCARQLGVDLETLATPYQVHSPDVATVTEVWPQGEGPKVDALVTNRTGAAIGIGTADCGSVLFADPQARVIGAAHSGWKGAISGVLDNTVKKMVALGARQEAITAVLGPTISQKAYEVGPEFVDRLIAMDSANDIYFVPSENAKHAMFDLPRFITDRLEGLGLTKVFNLDLCTYENEDMFYSYRRTTHRNEPDYGRLLSAIVLQ